MSLLARLLIALFVFRALGEKRPPSSGGASEPTGQKLGGLVGVRQVVLVGDSYAVGLEDKLGEFLRHRGIGFQFAAKVGATTTAVTASAREMYERCHPEVMVISTGANDGAHVAARLVAGEFQSWASDRGVRVLWLYPPTRARANWSPAMDQLWEGLPAPPMHLGDGQHPDRVTYGKWARAVVEKLELHP